MPNMKTMRALEMSQWPEDICGYRQSDWPTDWQKVENNIRSAEPSALRAYKNYKQYSPNLVSCLVLTLKYPFNIFYIDKSILQLWLKLHLQTDVVLDTIFRKTGDNTNIASTKKALEEWSVEEFNFRQIVLDDLY